ncbi:ATP12 chaperone protein [Roseivivax jejudonensis]|uniref:ATP12 chaperone protein n=1 Tax=Roseivivax jejudonensis TaxID=1529041 RepID=A0A1X6ZT52_9RHOB|nr:ATP12 family protein [Roseivivax jejudonensis]SLN58890.1 ATP12 chaperone protein [Roseivivax jejudonensis]
MSEWAAKRFWTDATVASEADGHTVRLDGRPVKTPAKAPLVVPTAAMAAAIADEWQAQGDKIDPLSMPVTRGANAAIDRVRPQHADVADMLAEYGDADLLCYRADGPEGLVERQAAAWDPLLDWAAQTLGARLEPRTGIMHAGQDAHALSQLRGAVHALDAFELTAFHDLVSLTGSLVIGFAAERGAHAPETLWAASRIDETWQAELWGEDEEAAAAEDHKRGAFMDAVRFLSLARSH